MKVVGAVLAAGSSRRLGHPKQLVPLADGRPLLRHVVEVAQQAHVSRLAVVLRPEDTASRRALQGLSIEPLASDAPEEGIAASIRAAVAWARQLDSEGLLLCVGDQPLLTISHLDALLRVLDLENQLVASFYDGRAGVPAAFPARYFDQLDSLHGDTGAQTLLRGSRDAVLVAWPEGQLDLDYPTDLAALAAKG